MKNYLGEIIFNHRQKDGLTQDQYGQKFGVSGPAIFKFEKGYVKPSLDLWLQIAADAALPQRRAVLLWAKSKLPEQFQDYLELQSEKMAETEEKNARKKGQSPDYAKFEDREQMRAVLARDKTLPKGLKELLEDGEVWALFKPTGHEINLLRDTFGPLGKGSKTTFLEALRLVREFTHSF